MQVLTINVLGFDSNDVTQFARTNAKDSNLRPFLALLVKTARSILAPVISIGVIGIGLAGTGVSNTVAWTEATHGPSLVASEAVTLTVGYAVGRRVEARDAI